MLKLLSVLGSILLICGIALSQGDNCGDAIVLSGMPILVEGSTCDFFADDYDAACPTAGTSPDMVYRYTPTVDMSVNIDLCLSYFNSKVYVFADDCSSIPLACNDDNQPQCAAVGPAYIGCLPLTAGHAYYIVVDGSSDPEECGFFALMLSRCYAEERPCQSCEPVNEDLGEMTSDVCGGSISGDLNYGGKWVAHFDGFAGVTYYWDLCSDMPCEGQSAFEGSDADLLIYDGNCQRLEYIDGDEFCGYTPNNWEWVCPADGDYYVMVSAFPSLDADTLTCNGNDTHTFTLVYFHTPVNPERTCQSCEPVNVNLGDITNTVCGGSISGDLAWDGKWIARFIGHAGADYHWDICPAEPCGGSDTFIDSDPDVLIYDSDCNLIDWVDGEMECGYRPNDWVWNCLDDGDYYVVVGVYPSLDADTLTCNGTADHAFTMVYYRTGGVFPGDRCDDASLIEADLPLEFTGNTCGYADDYEVDCPWQYTWTGGRDVVYRYIPTADEFVTIELCDSWFDAKLYLFAETCGELFACNDIDRTGICSNVSMPSLTCIELLAGVTYYIVVDAVNDIECGDYTLRLLPCTPPEGDVLQTAWTIPALPFTDANSTVNFYDQYVEDCGGPSYSPDVVYAYTPPADISVEVDLVRSPMPTRIYVYENNRTNLYACDNDGGGGQRSYIAPIMLWTGNTYYFVVECDNDWRGDYLIEIIPAVTGRCCHNAGCDDGVTARQCSYHFQHGTWNPALTCAAGCPPPSTLPGPLDSIIVPVLNGCGYGIDLASDCDGNLYYANTCMDSLYTVDADGNLLAAVQVTIDGWPQWFVTGCWDKNLDQLWVTRDLDVCLLNPLTGIATVRFRLDRWVNDMDFDPADGTLWMTEQEGNCIYHYTTDGTLLGLVMPLDVNGLPWGNLRGICSGLGDTLYIAHDAMITRHDRTTGAWRGRFARNDTWQARALTCDAANFAGQTILWWKFDDRMFAYSAPAGICQCGCPPAASVVGEFNPVTGQMEISFSAPLSGDFVIYGSEDR
ncbi:MAG: hypothetical protein ACOZB3_13190, partial [Calditrichota bacterium]